MAANGRQDEGEQQQPERPHEAVGQHTPTPVFSANAVGAFYNSYMWSYMWM